MTDGFPESTRTIRVGGQEVMVFHRYLLQPLTDTGEAAGRPVTIERRHATLGSAGDNDLVVVGRGVSRRHCEIVVDEVGYLLKDLGSKNGTLLDGNRVVAAYLKPGAVVGLGEERIAFSPGQDDVQVPLATGGRFGRLIGSSLEMRALFGTLEKVSGQEVTILIEGESGTGKELVAQEIHAHSTRKEGPFVVFDCSAVAEGVVESELFGHVKGAFTGAAADRPGAFAMAQGGTLFLDEIGELPLELQPKLLRAIEAGEVRPVGATQAESVNVRLVAATNRNLRQEVEAGAFRKDLYFRLDVVRLKVPPLRYRLEDVPALVTEIVRGIVQRQARGRPEPQVPSETLEMLMTYRWPGNVRELKNFVERYLVFAPADSAAAVELLEGGAGQTGEGGEEKAKGRVAAVVRFDLPYKEAKTSLLESFEIQYCRRLLVKNKGNISAAARDAGLHRKHMEELVKKHQLKGS